MRTPSVGAMRLASAEAVDDLAYLGACDGRERVVKARVPSPTPSPKFSPMCPSVAQLGGEGLGPADVLGVQLSKVVYPPPAAGPT